MSASKTDNTKDNFMYKNLKIHCSTAKELDLFCKKNKLKKTECINLMVAFFNSTKIDPSDAYDITASVKQLKSQLISFIRKQEKDKLNPMVSKVDVIVETVREFISANNNEEMKGVISKLADYLNKNRKSDFEIISQNQKQILKHLESIKSNSK